MPCFPMCAVTPETTKSMPNRMRPIRKTTSMETSYRLTSESKAMLLVPNKREARFEMTQHEHEPLAGQRAAVMIGPLFEDSEAVYPYYRLQEAGAEVQLIGIEGDAMVKGKKGIELMTDAAASDVAPDDLDILVIAGGYGPDKL